MRRGLIAAAVVFVLAPMAQAAMGGPCRRAMVRFGRIGRQVARQACLTDEQREQLAQMRQELMAAMQAAETPAERRQIMQEFAQAVREMVAGTDGGNPPADPPADPPAGPTEEQREQLRQMRQALMEALRAAESRQERLQILQEHRQAVQELLGTDNILRCRRIGRRFRMGMRRFGR